MCGQSLGMAEEPSRVDITQILVEPNQARARLVRARPVNAMSQARLMRKKAGLVLARWLGQLELAQT